MKARKALGELWDAVNDAASFMEGFDPEDQLDEDEVARGMSTRMDRYDLDEADKVLSKLMEDLTLLLAGKLGNLGIRQLVDSFQEEVPDRIPGARPCNCADR